MSVIKIAAPLHWHGSNRIWEFLVDSMEFTIEKIDFDECIPRCYKTLLNNEFKLFWKMKFFFLYSRVTVNKKKLLNRIVKFNININTFFIRILPNIFLVNVGIQIDHRIWWILHIFTSWNWTFVQLMKAFVFARRMMVIRSKFQCIFPIMENMIIYDDDKMYWAKYFFPI